MREGAAGARVGAFGAVSAVDVVVAAKAGDRQAMDELVAEYLPLVYNIVGRALGGDVDVDDVVQETMLRVVHGIDGLRDPDRFRSWLVAIAVRQINDRWRARRAGPAPLSALAGSAAQLPDPAADFVDLTILRLGLVGERRQIAEATAWLEPTDRQVASLWWLEAAGRLTRAELADALSLSAPHAAVRVQRMRNQLDLAREIIRVLTQTPRCPELDETIHGWDGHPSGLWRKRISRHVRHCPACGATELRMTPAEALLASLPLVPVPARIAAHPFVTTAIGSGHGASAAALATHGSRWLTRLLKLVLTKPAVVAVTAVVATSGAVAVYNLYPAPPPHAPIITPTPAAVITPTASASASATVTAASTPSAASAISATRPSKSATTAVTAAAYGSVVDQADAAPPADQEPGPLPQRPADAPITATGKYETTDGTASVYQMNYNGDELTVTGQGYFRIRWQIIYTTGRIGQLAMPTWTGLTGELFHVASGGGRRMDDAINGSSTGGKTGMGSTSTGYDTLPAGAQQMWQNEYYYLDGTVTLHQNQGYAWADLIVQPMTWQQITTDIDTAPDLADNIERYGLVRDTGTDTAPVPQYLTRSDPADPADVPQHSDVVGSG
jgi:RNA polymerase sigma factor (sigma-70 family)